MNSDLLINKELIGLCLATAIELYRQYIEALIQTCHRPYIAEGRELAAIYGLFYDLSLYIIDRELYDTGAVGGTFDGHRLIHRYGIGIDLHISIIIVPQIAQHMHPYCIGSS